MRNINFSEQNCKYVRDYKSHTEKTDLLIAMYNNKILLYSLLIGFELNALNSNMLSEENHLPCQTQRPKGIHVTRYKQSTC